MRDAGCFSVFCGTDAGSEKILKAMHKMPSTKRSYEFFENCMRLGIPFETNTIIGYPDETPEDLEAALEVVFDAISYGAGGSDASILQPLPGAEVTAEYAQSLEFVGDAGLGTFLPAEAAELARSRLEILSGFGFLALIGTALRVLPAGTAPHPLLRPALLPDSALLQGGF